MAKRSFALFAVAHCLVGEPANERLEDGANLDPLKPAALDRALV